MRTQQETGVDAFGYALFGPPTMYGTFGCNIEPTYQNGVWLQLGAGNGQIVRNINLNYAGQGSSLYDGQMPGNGVAICIPGDGSGSNRALIDEVTVSFVFTVIQTSCNQDQLGAENTIRKATASHCVAYFATLGTQNFANTIDEGSSGCVQNIYAQTGVGVAVRRGNYSAPFEQTDSNTFTISGTTALSVSGCGGTNCTYQFAV
jgi:hypothetical protein